jgi:hypothetical protein
LADRVRRLNPFIARRKDHDREESPLAGNDADDQTESFRFATMPDLGPAVAAFEQRSSRECIAALDRWNSLDVSNKKGGTRLRSTSAAT